MKTVSFILFAAAASFFPLNEKSREIERRIATEPSQKIELKGFNGSRIEFKSWDKNEVYIKLNVSISSSSDEFEDEYIKTVAISDKSSPTTVAIFFDELDSRHGEGFSLRKLFNLEFRSYVRKDIRGEIFVPQSNALYTDMRYGSLSLEDMKGVLELDGQSNTLRLKNCTALKTIRNNYGKSTLDDCGGALRLESQSGTVKVDDFKGSLDIEAKYSNITVSRVSESTTIHSQSGTLTIEDIGEDLSVESDYSTLTINRVKGLVGVSNKSGKIKIKTVDGVQVDGLYSNIDITSVSGKSNKPIKVRGQSGRLDLTDAVGDLVIDNPYSTMNLKNVKGNVELSSQSARITAENISGDWNSKTMYSSISIYGLTAQTVSIANKSNPVDVELVSKPTKLNINNEYGSVTVSLPSGFSGDVRLKATYGRIRSDLPVEVEDVGSGAIAIGKIGTGSGSMRIETTSGNIKVTQR
ncbi:MAG: DUF4097 family beta strand repeat protein [Ignavibacteriales bacterium]|nr:DUF4097 family beta strand repeat protein [Ignavibacteriales bacterium]